MLTLLSPFVWYDDWHNDTRNKHNNLTQTIYNRAIVEAAQLAALRYGLSYAAYSDDWVIVLQSKNRRHVICGYAFGLNNDAASSSANDKVATYELLHAIGLPAVPHFLVSTIADEAIDEQKLAALLTDHLDLVMKPLRGSRGDFVVRLHAVDEIRNHIKQSGEREWAASPFVDISIESRFVVFDGSIRLAYQKVNPNVKDGLKYFNLSQGASAKSHNLVGVPPATTRIAQRAMAVLGLRLGAVDIITDVSGKTSVLEINSHFSLDHFAASSPQNKASVLAFYDMLIRRALNIDFDAARTS